MNMSHGEHSTSKLLQFMAYLRQNIKWTTQKTKFSSSAFSMIEMEWVFSLKVILKMVEIVNGARNLIVLFLC